MVLNYIWTMLSGGIKMGIVEVLRLEISRLQVEIHNLQAKLEAFRSGDQYQSMKKEYEGVIKEKNREINRLKKELADVYAQKENVRNIWYDECEDILKETGRIIK